MKDIVTKISESWNPRNEIFGKGAFKELVKYSNNDYLKWKKETKDNKNLMFGEVDNFPEYELIYLVNHNKKIVEHIATYNTKKEELYCDDINFFGNWK